MGGARRAFGPRCRGETPATHLGEDERARRRFQREARAAAGLSHHPNVVTIYDVGEHAGRVFMVMEIMRGGTLGDRLKGT